MMKKKEWVKPTLRPHKLKLGHLLTVSADTENVKNQGKLDSSSFSEDETTTSFAKKGSSFSVWNND